MGQCVWATGPGMQVKIKRHPRFTRRGSDLHTEMQITLGESLVGFTKKAWNAAVLDATLLDATVHRFVIEDSVKTMSM